MIRFAAFLIKNLFDNKPNQKNDGGDNDSHNNKLHKILFWLNLIRAEIVWRLQLGFQEFES